MIVRSLVWIACVLGLFASLQPSRAAAQSAETVVFSIGTTIVSLNAEWIEPPAGPGVVRPLVPAPFSCRNLNKSDEVDWYAAKGQTAKSAWKTFKCSAYGFVEEEITLSIRGIGSHDELGFAEISFEFQLAFKEGDDFWPLCAQHTEVGPAEFSDIRRWERFDVDVAGRCGDWLISSRTTLAGGFSAVE